MGSASFSAVVVPRTHRMLHQLDVFPPRGDRRLRQVALFEILSDVKVSEGRSVDRARHRVRRQDSNFLQKFRSYCIARLAEIRDVVYRGGRPLGMAESTFPHPKQWRLDGLDLDLDRVTVHAYTRT